MSIRYALALLCFALAAPPVLAGPPHCPPGHAKKGWCVPGGGWRAVGVAPRERYVVIPDWRARGFRQPPRGAVWVSLDGDVLLVAAATGLILQALNR